MEHLLADADSRAWGAKSPSRLPVGRVAEAICLTWRILLWTRDRPASFRDQNAVGHILFYAEKLALINVPFTPPEVRIAHSCDTGKGERR